MRDKKNLGGDHYFSSSPQSKTNYGLIRAKFYGRTFEFMTASSVFSKNRIDMGTHLLIESVVLPESGPVLDMGCGYGAVGIAVAAFNSNLQVYMTDINERAVSLARKNIEHNKVFNAKVHCGNLYEPIKGLKFDCILSNPPVSAGMDTVKAIIAEAPKVMRTGAAFEMVIRSKIGAKTFPTLFIETFGNCIVIARESGFRVLLGKYNNTES